MKTELSNYVYPAILAQCLPIQFVPFVCLSVHVIPPALLPAAFGKMEHHRDL
jgi:hypothetical protein